MLWKSRWQKLAWMSAIATLVVGSFFVAHNVSWHDPQQRAVYTTQDSIGAVAINPDQTRIAADSTNGSITIWRRDTGMIVQSWVAANTKITELHFRPDSYSLVVGSEDSAVRLWDSASGQLLRTFGDAPNSVQPNSANRDSSFQTLPPSGIHALALSPDDRLIAVGGEQGRINVFALNTGAVMLRLRRPRNSRQSWICCGCCTRCFQQHRPISCVERRGWEHIGLGHQDWAEYCCVWRKLQV